MFYELQSAKTGGATTGSDERHVLAIGHRGFPEMILLASCRCPSKLKKTTFESRRRCVWIVCSSMLRGK